MKNLVNLTDKSSNIWYIKLTPETEAERELLERNDDEDSIRIFYDMAILEALGKDYVLLAVVNQSQWPYAAQVTVQRVMGLG